MADLLFLVVYLIIFTIILFAISGYIFLKLLKAEKEAFPYLRGLFIYFLLMALVNLIQSIIFMLNPSISYNLGVYNNYIVVCLIYFAPVFLIYQIERLYFPEQKILSKYHIISLFVIVSFVIFLIWTGIEVIINPTLFQNFEMGAGLYRYLNYATWFVIVMFICLSFLYLAFRASGKFRIFSIIISIGWGTNQVINAVTQLLAFNRVIQLDILTIIFIIKFVGAITTAIGFFKLYSVSEYA
jgi:hypothetical protein